MRLDINEASIRKILRRRKGLRNAGMRRRTNALPPFHMAFQLKEIDAGNSFLGGNQPLAFQPRATTFRPSRAGEIALPNTESVAALRINVQLSIHIRALQSQIHHEAVLD